MKLGINSYTYMWSIGFEGARPRVPLDAAGLLDKARQLGVKLVQTGPNLPVENEATTALINYAQQEGIELELGTRGLELNHLLHWIRICQAAKARLLRTVPELGGQTPQIQQLISILRQIKPYLAETNVRLGLENGYIPCRELRHAIEETGSDQIGVVLDMVNSLAIPEGWKEVTEILAPHTVCLHYKDFSIQRAWHMMGFTCEGRPAGQGQLEPEWLFHTLQQSRYDFNVIIELWTPEQKSLEETIELEQEWAEASVNFLRKYIPD